MTKYLDDNWSVDDWDDPIEDKSNWSEWELWQRWSEKYEWEEIEEIECLEPHDVIVFRDLIFSPERAGRGKKAKIKKWVYVGERLHIAHWIKNKDGYMFLKTIYTEGDRPIKPGTKTKRKIKNAMRYGLKRLPVGQGAVLILPGGELALNSQKRGFEKPVSSPAVSKQNTPAISRFQVEPKNET